MSEQNLSDYSEYFYKEGNDLYIRRDFIDRIQELRGASLKQLLNIAMTNFRGESSQYIKHKEAFVAGKYLKPRKPQALKEYIPSDLRWAVWERDNYTCQHCGSRKNLTVDHVFPEIKGGKATLENCQTLCKSCNSRKGAR